MTARAHDPGRGVLRAARYAPRRVAEALGEFHKLNNRDARAAFADHWIGLWARDFNEAWPMLYELLKLVEDDKLYQDPRRVGPGAGGSEHGEASTYGSFSEYFEDRVGQSFGTWAELENTYQYAHQNMPGLFGEKFERAQVVASRTTALHEEIADGKTLNSALGRPSVTQSDNKDNIRITTPDNSGGTSADYLTRRIVRDHPEIAERMKAGEYKSVRAAALDAGIAPRTLTIRLDAPASVARSLRKHMSEENFTDLIRLLLEGDP